MRLVRSLTCLALLGAGLTALTTTGPAGAVDPDDGAADRPRLLQQLRQDADGSVTISGEDATHKLGFIRAGRHGDLMPSSDAGPVAKADAFLAEYGALLGASSGNLVRESVRSDRYGSTVTYTQRYRGLPVFGTMLRAHFDKSGDLTGVNGVAVPNLNLSVDPVFSQAEAAQAAVRTVRADPPGQDGEPADTTGIRAGFTQLVVYRHGLVQGKPGPNELVWQVEVTNGQNVRDMVFISATTGKPVNRYSMIHDALHRIVYEQQHTEAAKVWEEGDPFPGDLNEDQQNIVHGSGEAYWFFSNVFGRDSYDGQGHAMETVNNDPRIACPNANWNGITTNYCNGVTADDVVAHEWGHAYTEFTHGLVYQWQSGALNESYSDIWGETVDLINGRMDEDEGDLTAKRPDGLCATEGPRAVQLVINSPADIAKVCLAGVAAWGAVPDTTGVTGDIVLGLDPADEAGPSTTDGCSPLTNAAEVEGNIGLVYRGTCPFTQKAQNLVDAGAIAVVIGNNAGGAFTPGGELDPPLTVPVIGIAQADADRVVGGLDSGAVNGTVRLSGSAESADSFRWLMGEDSPAFGGAIRDMWVPTCAGDPGKVTDAEYHCSTDDNGGVHTNSGVPNHGYALLVDGGDYNGITVPGIGLTKAAAIYFRAMTEYQTPTTTFADHADALEAACTDLIGQPLHELSTQPNDSTVSDEVIAATDCAAVAAMAQAVELRTEPVQCNFRPLLDPDTPTLCASGKPNTFYRESFSDRLNGWTRSNTAVFDPEAGEIPWVAANDLPGDRPGKAAYAPDPVSGDCTNGVGDLTGVSRLISPLIRTPNRSGVLALSFKHYVATEVGWDGGNLKISVNNGPYEAIPDDAFMFNPYNTTINSAAAGNTNPLESQPGFTGTDGGEATGSWGESQIDLSMMDIKPGDRLRLRFDFGRDGCNGLDGWYVDDIRLSFCKATSGVAAAAREARQ